MALAVGAGWLATILMVNAVISPAMAGVVYMATTLVWLVVALRFVNPTQIVARANR